MPQVRTYITHDTFRSRLVIEGAAGSGGGAAVHHTLQRHTEILADYRGEFSKTSSNIAAMMEREELLGSVSQVEE